MRRIRIPRFLQTLSWLLLILVCWELVSRLGIVSAYLLPPFSDVAVKTVTELFFGKYGMQIVNSMRLILIGLTASVTAAILLVLMCVHSKIMESFITSLCTIANPLPGMAIISLLLMWFGIGDGVIIALICHAVVWPLITNILSGFRSIPPIYNEWVKNIRLGPINNLFHVLTFAIMPNILAGLRVGWGRAWRALISAEMVFGMIGNHGGLGYYIYTNRAYGNITKVFVGVLTIVVIGVLVEQIFRAIEKATVIKWGMSNEK